MEKYERSLAIYEKMFGMNHMDTIGTRSNIEILKRKMLMTDE